MTQGNEGKTGLFVMDPSDVEFLRLIQHMSPHETDALRELMRVVAGHEPDNVIRDAAQRCAEGAGLSVADAAEVTDNLMQWLADGRRREMN